MEAPPGSPRPVPRHLALVRYLSAKYDITARPPHILGHDNVPPDLGRRAAPAMHWDPGPFWDWGHFMSLSAARIKSPGPPATTRSSPSTPAPRPTSRPCRDCEGNGPAARRHQLRVPADPTRPVHPLFGDPGLHPACPAAAPAPATGATRRPRQKPWSPAAADGPRSGRRAPGVVPDPSPAPASPSSPPASARPRPAGPPRPSTAAPIRQPPPARADSRAFPVTPPATPSTPASPTPASASTGGLLYTPTIDSSYP